MLDQQIARQQRWEHVAPDADDATLTALDRLQEGVDAERHVEQHLQRQQQDAARSASVTTRQTQADADVERVAGLFTAAWRAGMGRGKLQAAAVRVLREDERRAQERLVTFQQAGNHGGQRQASAALVALQRQSALLTPHRAGKWLQSHHPPPPTERQ